MGFFKLGPDELELQVYALRAQSKARAFELEPRLGHSSSLDLINSSWNKWVWRDHTQKYLLGPTRSKMQISGRNFFISLKCPTELSCWLGKLFFQTLLISLIEFYQKLTIRWKWLSILISLYRYFIINFSGWSVEFIFTHCFTKHMCICAYKQCTTSGNQNQTKNINKINFSVLLEYYYNLISLCIIFKFIIFLNIFIIFDLI